MSESDSYDAIFKAVNGCAMRSKRDIPKLDGGFFDAEQTEIDFKFAHNVVISGDTVTFDAGIEATFIIQGNRYND